MKIGRQETSSLIVFISHYDTFSMATPFLCKNNNNCNKLHVLRKLHTIYNNNNNNLEKKNLG